MCKTEYSLAVKTAMDNGAGRGIGCAISILFAKSGTYLAIDMKVGIRSSAEELLDRYVGKPPPGLPDVERLKHPYEGAEFVPSIVTMPEGGPNGQTFSLARRPR